MNAIGVLVIEFDDIADPDLNLAAIARTIRKGDETPMDGARYALSVQEVMIEATTE